ncbi:alpha/beta hydrolase [Halopseudomonas maritima]|uniref:alpha/beta hydrolase n=1 Tax=Halopseudomonas maritima TaxID=2918528 RepID=UPI001EECE8D6|nr:alpha/beta fold hydrolase [Halopseudomonas maritima]UJJ31166.1 alpha/beta fold hydrolase [Halopseudomonas maritima]
MTAHHANVAPPSALDSACRAFSVPQRIQASSLERSVLSQGKHDTHPYVDGDIAHWTFGLGPRVLLVHGWDSRGSHLAAFIEPLLRAGFSVTLLDLPAHGDSGGHLSSPVHAGRALASLAQALGPIHGVVAHSLGSAASLWAFAHGLEVNASVHLCGPSSLSPMLQLQALGHGLSPDEQTAFVSWVEKHIGIPVAEMDLAALKHGLRHTGLIMHDPADRLVPFAASTDLQRQWPGAKLIELEGLGHRRILTDPQVIARSCALLSGARRQEAIA